MKILPAVTVLLLLLLAGGVGFLIKSNLEEKETNESGKSSFYKYNLKVRIYGSCPKIFVPKVVIFREKLLERKINLFLCFSRFLYSENLITTH